MHVPDCGKHSQQDLRNERARALPAVQHVLVHWFESTRKKSGYQEKGLATRRKVWRPGEMSGYQEKCLATWQDLLY